MHMCSTYPCTPVVFVNTWARSCAEAVEYLLVEYPVIDICGFIYNCLMMEFFEP